jgi:hypothetical protein
MGWVKRVKIGGGTEMDWLVRLAGDPLESYQKYIKEKEK